MLFLLPVLPRQNKSAMVINFKNDIPLTIDCFLRRGRIWIIVNRRRMTMKKNIGNHSGDMRNKSGKRMCDHNYHAFFFMF